MSGPADEEEARKRRRRDRLAMIGARLGEHLAQLQAQGVELKCPICGNDEWALFGTESGTPFNETVDASGADPWSGSVNELLTSPVLPKVVVHCGRCFFVAEFAWMKIKNATKR